MTQFLTGMNTRVSEISLGVGEGWKAARYPSPLLPTLEERKSPNKYNPYILILRVRKIEKGIFVKKTTNKGHVSVPFLSFPSGVGSFVCTQHKAGVQLVLIGLKRLPF